MTPRKVCYLNKYGRGHLKNIYYAFTGEQRQTISLGLDTKYTIWGAGKGYTNNEWYEIIGSKLSNTGRGAAAASKMYDSYIRCIVCNEDGTEVSYFRRVL